MTYRAYVSEYRNDVAEIGTAVSNIDDRPVVVITMFSPSSLALATRNHLENLYRFINLREDEEKTRIVLSRVEGRPLTRFIESTGLDHGTRVQIALELLKKIRVYDGFPNPIKKKLISEDQILLNEEGVQLREIVNFAQRDVVSDQEVVAQVGRLLSILLPDSSDVERALINQMKQASHEFSTIGDAYRAFRDLFIYEVPATVEKRIIINAGNMPEIDSDMIDAYQEAKERRKQREIDLAEERRKEEQIRRFNEKIDIQTDLSLEEEALSAPVFTETEIPLQPTRPDQPFISSGEMDYYGISIVKRPKEAAPGGDGDFSETLAGTEISAGEEYAQPSERASWTPDVNGRVAIDMTPDPSEAGEFESDETDDAERQKQIQQAVQSVTDSFKSFFETFQLEQPFEVEEPKKSFREEPSDDETAQSGTEPASEPGSGSNYEPDCEPDCEPDSRLDADLRDGSDEPGSGAAGEKHSEPQIDPLFEIKDDLGFRTGVFDTVDDPAPDENAAPASAKVRRSAEDRRRARPDETADDAERESEFFSPGTEFQEDLDEFYGGLEAEKIRKRKVKHTMTNVLLGIVLVLILFFSYRIVVMLTEPLKAQFEISKQSDSKVAVTNTSTGRSKAAGYHWEVYYGDQLIKSSQDFSLILEFKLEGEYKICLRAEDKEGNLTDPFEKVYSFRFGE